MTAKKKPAAVKQEEVYHPMAAPEPSPLERLEAAEIQLKLMKDALNYLYQQHYRKDAV
jgi:hypothetical protein